MPSTHQAGTSWDDEYARGRYRNEPPLPFVDDIIAAAHRRRVAERTGLYIGCGNGRNYLSLVAQGLDLIGLDVSGVAIGQLSARAARPDRLVHGDLASLASDDRYGLVVGIQVFQHGDREQVHRHIAEACERVDTDGLLAIRVNATDTQLEFEHEVIERSSDGSFTVRYLEGPKRGLLIHFFAQDELSELMGAAFDAELPLRLYRTERTAPAAGHWSQWEAIWHRIDNN